MIPRDHCFITSIALFTSTYTLLRRAISIPSFESVLRAARRTRILIIWRRLAAPISLFRRIVPLPAIARYQCPRRLLRVFPLRSDLVDFILDVVRSSFERYENFLMSGFAVIFRM